MEEIWTNLVTRPTDLGWGWWLASTAAGALAILVTLLLAQAFLMYFDRKVWAAVQMRKGPNVVGLFGLLQSFADLLKFVFKEIVIPAGVNKVVFILAPMITFVLALVGWAVIPVAVAASGLFGAAWAFLPGWLQAHRGSHVVITTIMFNFLASALMVHLMVNVLIQPGQMSPESREFAPSVWLPFVHEMLAWAGIKVARSPLNLSILWAGLACVFVWLLINRTRWGYAIRTVGHNDAAAVYAGIDPKRVIVGTMCISGALAGFVGINEILGVQHRLLLNFTAGYGFTGIAVALMGRAHPVGIVLASLLFGALYQGGTELDFEFDNITRDLVVVIQGLVILFSGALAYMLHPLALRLWQRRRREGAP